MSIQLINLLKKPLVLILGIGLIIVLILWLNPKSENPSGDSWNTFIDTTQNISFQYPNRLPTKYIATQEWPPAVQITQLPAYPCPAGSREIDGKFSYCIQTQTEGAAGSTYTTYTYSTGSFGEGKTATISFTLRFVQCGNYDNLQKTECEQERQAFDLDGLVDRIAHSISFR